MRLRKRTNLSVTALPLLFGLTCLLLLPGLPVGRAATTPLAVRQKSWSSGLDSSRQAAIENLCSQFKAGQQPSQNFDAVLVGDVSGTRTPAGPQPAKPTAPQVLISVVLPTMVSAGATTVMLPITVSSTTGLGIDAYTFRFTFDPSVIQLQNPSFSTTGTLSSTFPFVTSNTTNPGQIQIAAFGAPSPISGSGTLIFIKFDVIGANGTMSPLTWNFCDFGESSASPILINGSYTVTTPTAESEPNDCPETANPVDVTGCSISGQIATISDVDFYTFTAPAGAKVWAYVDTPGDSLLTLYGPCIAENLVQLDNLVDGLCSTCALQLEVDDNDGTGNGGDSAIESVNASAIAGASLDSTGTYYLRVSNSAGSVPFSYRLFVVVTTGMPTAEVEPNDTPATANEVFSVGQTSGVVAGSGNSTDFYKVCLAAGDVLYVSLDGDPNDDGGADHTLTLIDPTAMTVLFSTNSSNSTGDPPPPAEAFSYNITVPGTYYIQVLPVTAAPNEYQFMASRCGSGTPNCAVQGQTELSITKTDTPDPVQANNLLTYTITVTNTSQVAAAGVTVTDPLPAGTVFISAAASPGSTLVTPTVGTNGTVTAIQATLAPGATFSVVIVVRVNCSVPNDTVLSNTATVSTTTPETNPNNNMATATTTVTNPAPTITCPGPVIAVASQTCPPSANAIVTFNAPVASDQNNCPVVVVCNPPSGSIFPIGTTTVTCTATDASGNTATCSFTVTVFSGCLQDDSNPANVVLFNAATGEYRFCCNGTVFTGVGTVLVKGCTVTIQHYPADRRVLIKFDGAVGAGTASLQSPPGSIRCTTTDRNTRDNTCACP